MTLDGEHVPPHHTHMLFGPDDLTYLEAATVLIRPSDFELSETVYLLEVDGHPTGIAVRSHGRAEAWAESVSGRSYRQILLKDLAE